MSMTGAASLQCFSSLKRTKWWLYVLTILLPLCVLVLLFCLFMAHQSVNALASDLQSQQTTTLSTHSLNSSRGETAQSADSTETRIASESASAQSQQATGASESLASWIRRALFVTMLLIATGGLLLVARWRAIQTGRALGVIKMQQEQDAILLLLDQITPLAQGDLRVRATVSEASTGAVADAVNYAVEELCRLVLAVKKSADIVKASVVQTRQSADELAKASSVQAREIHRSSNYLNVMSDTMAQLSANAVDSSRIAEHSVVQARQAGDAVNANVDGLQRIRQQAETSIRMMQCLHESSGAINERVEEIAGLAKRSDLLALNAAIKASAAVSGGSPTGISQVSDDVAYLSDALGRAASDIARITETIHRDAALTLESMRKTIDEVDDSEFKAQQASLNLSEIESVSAELNDLINDIASKSLRQAGVVKQLSANMGVINNITRESSMGMQSSARALDRLQDITAELKDSVSGLRLPVSAEPTKPTAFANGNSNSVVRAQVTNNTTGISNYKPTHKSNNKPVIRRVEKTHG